MSSSILLRRSSSFGSNITADKLSRVPTCRDLCLMVVTSSSPTRASVCTPTGISSGCTCCENPLFIDGWRERSSYLRRLLSVFTPEQIGATLFPKSASSQLFQTLGERKRLLESSPFPLRTMEDVVADTPYARVMTHSFFPSSVAADAPPPTTLPYPTGATQPVPIPLVSIPPAESFFSPISLLPNAPLSMPVPPMMHSALSASRLYRSPAFVRELGSTNPEWNLAHSHPFQSLAFGAFT